MRQYLLPSLLYIRILSSIMITLFSGCSPSSLTQGSVSATPSPSSTVQPSNASTTVTATHDCAADSAASEARQHIPRAILPGSEGDYTSVLSVTDLVAISDLVVLGTIIPTNEILTYSVYSSPSKPSTDGPLGFTRIYTVEVEQIIKGTAPTAIKLVGVEGGIIETPNPDRVPTQIAAALATSQLDQRFIQWRTDTRYLLFLRPSIELPGMVGCYLTLSDNPGSFIVRTNGDVELGPPGIIASTFVIPSSQLGFIEQVEQAMEQQGVTHRP